MSYWRTIQQEFQDPNGCRPHDLRHTCASLAVSAGVNVLALQRMLGHTSAKMTLDTYADLFDDDLDAVAVTLHSRYSREVTRNCGQNVATEPPRS
jgi:integrase